jgi:phosphomannomutase
MSEGEDFHATAPIMELAAKWLECDPDPETAATIRGLVGAGNTAELEKRLRHRIEFGTAGLRGAMDAGWAHMNAVTVIEATVGIMMYLREKEGKSSPKVVIGYDGRRNSARFATLVLTTVSDACSSPCFFPFPVATPFVAMMVKQLEADVGIMITASHNPAADNGYKVFWNTGAQIVPPIDSGIAASIKAWAGGRESNARSFGMIVADADSMRIRLTEGSKGKELEKEFDETVNFFMREGVRKVLRDAEGAAAAPETETAIVYTAMHGVGTPFTMRALKEVANFTKVYMVPEQCYPDPYFRTVEFPNPEEGKSALNLAIRTADAAATRADIILANDPDADRLAVAERRPGAAGAAGGPAGWRVFTGNEIGALLGAWLVQVAVQDRKMDLSKCAVLSSTVSSAILRSIAAHPDNKGLHFEETLTGFKYLGTRTKLLEGESQDEASRKTVLFAFEEAIGFMCGSFIRDKDGITAAACVADLLRWGKQTHGKGWTLHAQLDAVYAKYGLHASQNSYVISRDAAKTRQMFDALRNGGKYPTTVGGVAVKSVRDLIPPGYDSTQADGKPVLPLSAGSPMITMELANGVRFTVRASGTEPKVKYYTEIVAPPGSGADEDAVNKTLSTTVDAIISELMQPAKYGFEMRKA